MQGQHGPCTTTLSPLRHQACGCHFAKWQLCPVASPEQGWRHPYILPHEVQGKPCWDPCSSFTQLPPGSGVHPESPWPQTRGGPFSPPRAPSHPGWGAAWGSGGQQLTALAPTLRNGHTLVTTPLSPQTLKIVRTAELSPFIVFIAPTDKAEQVGGRAGGWQSAEPECPISRACLPMAGGQGACCSSPGLSPCSTAASSCLH